MAFTPKPLITFDSVEEDDEKPRAALELPAAAMGCLSAVHRGDAVEYTTAGGLTFQRCGGGRRVIRKAPRGNY